MNRIISTLLLAIIWLWVGQTSSEAVTIHWGSAIGDFIYESDGTTKADSSSYQFELGTFSAGFTPDASNMADWETNWHTLDIGSYSQTTGRFAGTVSLINEPSPRGSILDGNATDTAEFFFGKDAYVWMYNQNTTIDETLEWALISNPDGGGDPAVAWKFPTSSEAGVHTEVRDFALSDDGVTAGFGSENGPIPSTGEGEFTGTPIGSYGIQTFTIPEPSSAVLALLGLVLTMTRRRRE